MQRFALVVAVLALSSIPMLGQATASAQVSQVPVSTEQEKGYISYIDFSGSSNEDGHVLTLGLSAGYQFNRHVNVSARLPIYLVGTTSATTSSFPSGQRGSFSNNDVGDPSFALTLGFSNRALAFQTGVAVSTPVTDTSNGFSTGDSLVDWTSRASVKVGRMVPFGRLDIGNTVPDTPVFFLPYTAQGFNARLEGGANFVLTKIVKVGASGYAVLPSGEQHVYSRMVTGNNSGIPMTPVSTTDKQGFMMEPVTVGNDLTRDHGVSAWLTANLPHYVDLQIAYSRSYGYDLNTVSFGVGYDLGAALRHHHANK